MKAMLYADWLSVKQVLRSMLLLIFFFTFIALFWNGVPFLTMILCIVSITVPSTLCAQDKSYGWDKLRLSLPVLRRDIISSKFVMSGLVNVSLALLCCAVSAVRCLLIAPKEELTDSILPLLLCEAIALLLMGLSLTVTLKWGTEKARYILVLAVWIPILLIFCVDQFEPFAQLGVQADALLDKLNTFDVPHFLLFALACIGAALLAYFLCYTLSVRVYQETDL